MLDKFTIGPVTIVQLVGLNAKPRIPSAQADGAVRAADPIPLSAAAGLGEGLSQPIAEIEASSFAVRAAPILGLSADPVRAQISLESGADRPVVDANAPAPAIDPSAFDLLLPDNGLTAPIIGGRDTQPLTDDGQDDTGVDGPALPDTPATGSLPDAVSELGYIFDGVESFGDDQILDFTIEIDSSVFGQDAKSSAISSSELGEMLAVAGSDGFGTLFDIDCSDMISYNPEIANNDYLGPHHGSATEAVPPM